LDRQLEDAVSYFDGDPRYGGVCMLGGVRECFRDHVIGSHL
jgi:hypothetical protein